MSEYRDSHQSYSNKDKIDHYLRKSDGPLDCSGYEPPKDMKTEEQTGACKAKPRAFKRGGAVGEATHKHAGRKSRDMGGQTPVNVGSQVPAQRFNFSNPSRNSGMYGAAKGGCMKKSSGGDADNDADDRMSKAKGGKADHWIAGAVKHPGALHKELGVPEGKKIPEKKLEKAEHSKNPIERKRANLAETLKGMHKAGGGRAQRAKGGWAGDKEDYEAATPSQKASWSVDHAINGAKMEPEATTIKKPPQPTNEKRGGTAVHRAHGGRTKGKTNVNIIIATGERKPMGGQNAPPMALGAPMAQPPMPPGVGPSPSGIPPMGGSPPPMGPRPMPPGMPMRAEGGRLVEPGYPKAMESGKGSGGGLGRLAKAKEYGP